ncbi:MAG TPA: leucyl aminopeptidase [Acidimicrobiales bacterium]|nr:leucyl aminopeptidase [Acidimicrobiales bacterium]
MPLTVTAAPDLPDGVEVVGIPVAEGPTVQGDGHGVEPGQLEARGFEAKVGETVALPGRGDATVVAVGVGPAADVGPDVLRRAAAALVRAAWKRDLMATTLLAAVPDGGDRAAAARAAAEGAALAAYRFTRYKSDPDQCRLDGVVLVAPDADELEEPLRRTTTVVEAVELARDLVNEPGGSLSPSELADRARRAAEAAGLGVEVLDEVAASELGLGGLLGVAAGSHEPPRLIQLTYDPPGAQATVALVGKGITFDSGGLSIKTAEGMMTMKTDMGGGAAVIAAMAALPALAPPVKVLGFVPATENMPGGRATRPGDVLRTRNGTTVEVLNTDAEGRLVLADGLALAVEEEPDAIVDLATLTGACITALGNKIMGLMGNDDGLIDQVRSAAERAGEPAWPLPLPQAYRKQLDSEVADLKNIGGRSAGALTAGLFLQEFVGEVPWVHLDIAGPSRADEDDGPVAKGATGVGVRTLLELLAGDPGFPGSPGGNTT